MSSVNSCREVLLSIHFRMDYYENPTRAQSFIDVLINDYGVTDQSLQRVLAAIGEGK